MRPLIILAFLLAGCTEGTIGDDTDTGSGDTDTADDSGDTGEDTADTSDSCVAVLNYQSPVANETNVSVSKVVTIRFTVAIDADDFTLTIDGVTGTAALAQNGLSATFTPTADLATETTYTLRASVCGMNTVNTFETASGPIEAANLEGKTYAIAYDDVTFVEPSAMGTILGFLGQQPFEYVLFNVIDIDEMYETITTASGPGVTADPGGNIIQDPCAAPTAFDAADFSGNPVIEVGPSDLTFDAGGTPLTVQAAHFKAAFVDDGASIEGVDISGQIDAAPLTASVGFDLCTGGAILGISCVSCLNTPSSMTCINIHFTADHGDYVDGLVYDPLLDPTGDPSCN